MELRHPLLLIILLIAVGAFFYLQKGKKRKYDIGIKIANTQYIKKSNYYKEKLRKYNLYKKIITVCSILSILISVFMLSRPSKVQTKDLNEYNRDIILCMDISGSVDELNQDLVSSLKDTVKSLKGERFGISIFNSSSVTLAPLTDDYEFVLDVLDNIERAFKNYYDDDMSKYDAPDYWYIRNYITSGTLEGSGSSLIGDGLASCVFSFSNMEEDRTRIIILSTDNEPEGKQLVDLPTAADIANSKKIKVFGIATEFMRNKNAEEYRASVEKTGGKYYEHSKTTVKNIVSDIEKTSKTILKDQTDTSKTDIPLIPFICLLISFSILMVLNKKVIE